METPTEPPQSAHALGTPSEPAMGLAKAILLEPTRELATALH